MAYLTPLEIIDAVTKHLLKQSERSLSVFGCSYRGEHNKKCAVGCLIPDIDYREWIEDSPIGDFDRNHFKMFLPDIEFSIININLLKELQYIHDSVSPDSWKDHLTDLRKEYESK